MPGPCVHPAGKCAVATVRRGQALCGQRHLVPEPRGVGTVSFVSSLLGLASACDDIVQSWSFRESCFGGGCVGTRKRVLQGLDLPTGQRLGR